AYMETDDAKRAPGVLAIVTAKNAGKLAKGSRNTAKLLGGPAIDHYHQAIALVVAESFEQASAAAQLIHVDYEREDGAYDLAEVKAENQSQRKSDQEFEVGDFDTAFATAPIQLDQTYSTPDQSHAAMEPHATTAVWKGDELTVWTSNQMIAWGAKDLAKTLGIPQEKIHLMSPYIGGGFGGKLFLRADVLLAALGAREAGRPVKVALARPMIFNNTTHRPATIQRIRLGANRDGALTAIGHESWSGNLPGGEAENAVAQTKLLYAGANRLVQQRLAVLDLPEGNAMRAPGEAAGMLALEIAMDEMAEKLGMDPVEFRIKNDTQVDPNDPSRPFSQRRLIECLRTGAERFGWNKRLNPSAPKREGRYLIGLGMAAGFRNAPVTKSAARVSLEPGGRVTIETDMTDIGTGSYTIIGQTAAEMLGVPLEQVVVKLGDSRFPVSSGSGGQWGANSSTSGVYAACVKLRETLARKVGFNSAEAEFMGGQIRAGNRSTALTQAAAGGTVTEEDGIEFGEVTKKNQLSTFAAHFVEVKVDAATGETRVRRMLAVCDAGRILNPKTARSQVIGAMTMGVGAALMEELAVDTRLGYFVNHDLAAYEVPVHADIPHQEVIFLEGADSFASPMKAKGVAELGICGVGAAVANAIYNATGVRVRDYPITLDKLIGRMPMAV
ncbi:MAG TPA: aldehyde oxidoreductase molybdenum-binding subunit PaoC, partial [Reyranella sp.]|nr:aldehyde oxidoreductase molybdenum-binding subunit PaoC [Reyranella sp.]